MGRIGVTQQAIYNAAQIIAAKGKFPTTIAVRNMLGSGSISTIHKHLQTWKQERVVSPYLNVAENIESLQVQQLQKENNVLTNKLWILQAEVLSLKLENKRLMQGTKWPLFDRLTSIGKAVLFRN